MLKRASKELGFNLRSAYFVGDTIRDVLTARKAGCKPILVLSGKEKISNQKNWEAAPEHVFKNLNSAADFLIKSR
jgi:phosphoglycolate phosphatase-like HAD superfamily hydrolase